jgi:hypothetical protein
MRFEADQQITLDYGKAATPLLLENLSGVAACGDFLWSVSDEGRTVECLKRDGNSFILHDQIVLDDLIPDIPGRDKDAELDLESIDITDRVMWLCGSHCRVRKKPNQFSSAMRTMSCSTSRVMRGLPGPRRAFEPSNLLATSLRTRPG